MTLKTKDQLASQVYFVVGRGTEGGSDSTTYQINIAGVRQSAWTQEGGPVLRAVSANSGYTIGAMQLDLGARGTWRVGSVERAKPGETTYVDAIVDNAKAYADDHGTYFPDDTSALRAALLTHGDGELRSDGSRRTSITFIDRRDRDAIDAWAGSPEGRAWIYQNVDMPIVSDAANKAYEMVQKYGSTWTDDQKNLAALELAKIDNQVGSLSGLTKRYLGDPSEKISFDTFVERTAEYAGSTTPPLHAAKALAIAKSFQEAEGSNLSAWLDSAMQKVTDPNFDPQQFRTDPDLALALRLAQASGGDHKVVVRDDGTLDVVLGQMIYRYASSADGGSVNLDVVSVGKNGKETVIGGECYAASQIAQAANAPQPTETGGHWEDRTEYDLLTGLPIGGENRVWVPDSSIANSAPKSSPSTTPIDAGGGIGSSVTRAPINQPTNLDRGLASDSPPTPHQTNPPNYAGDVKVVHNADGSVTWTSTYLADFPESGIKRGDVLTLTDDAQGRFVYQSVRHVEGGVTTLTETRLDPATHERITTATDSRVIDGVRFTRDHNAPEAEFRDANGRTVAERAAADNDQELARLSQRGTPTAVLADSLDGEDPHSVAAVNGSDLESDRSMQARHASSSPPPGAADTAADIAANFNEKLIELMAGGAPTAGPRGPALAAADGGILTDAGLQRPNAGLLPAQDNAAHQAVNDPSAMLRNTAGNSIALGQSLYSAYQTLGNSHVGDQGRVGAVLSVMDQGQRLADGLDAKAPGASAPGSTVLGDMAALFNLAETFSHSGNDAGKAVATLNAANTLSSGNVYNSAAQQLGVSGTAVGAFVSALPALVHGDLKGAALSAASAYVTAAITEAATAALVGTTAATTAAVAATEAASAAVAVASAEAGAEIGSAVPVVGTVIGAAVGYVVGTIFGGLLGDSDPPPPPEGHTHFSLDATGQPTVVLDADQSGGGAIAMQAAQDVLTRLQDWVAQTNAQLAEQRGTEVQTFGWALNPFALPSIGYRDGELRVEPLHTHGKPEDLMQQVAQAIADTPTAVLPAWQAAALRAYWADVQGDPELQALIARNALHLAPLSADENVDHLTQALHTLATDVPPELLARLQAAAQPADATQTLLQATADERPDERPNEHPNERLFDIDGDGYQERTAWVGPGQALLAIDLNHDGTVNDGRELLTRHGDTMGTNNADWLDTHADGVLDARDPAFAALRLWLDVNGDGIDERGESLTMAQAGITAVDLRNGRITWADGRVTALSPQTQQADTSGVKLTTVRDAEGHELNAGAIVENEGYLRTAPWVDGSQQAVRRRTYGIQLAQTTGDWQGTDEAAEHRHGGGVAADGPTETTAGGAVSTGPTRRDVSTTSTRVDTADGRLASAAAVNPAAPDAQATLDAGDTRIGQGRAGQILTGAGTGPHQAIMAAGLIASAATVAATGAQQPADEETTLDAGDARLGQGAAGTTSAGQSAGQRSSTLLDRMQIRSAPLGVLPLGSTSAPQALREATADMIRSAEDPMFASPLMALALGAGLTQWPTLASADADAGEAQTRDVAPPPPAPGTGYTVQPGDEPTSFAPPASAPVFDAAQVGTDPGWGPGHAVADVQPLDDGLLSVTVPAWRSAPGQPAPWPSLRDEEDASTAGVQSLSPAGAASTAASAAATAPAVIDYPQLQGEQLPGVEDTGSRIPESALLANDSTINGSTDSNRPALRIVDVGHAVHGAVSLQTSVDADGHRSASLLFTPDPNFHGTASFDYTVSDAYGLTRTTTATVNVAAVNDLPVTADEAASGDEDTALYFRPAELLANDTDVDTSADPGIGQGQTLVISALHDAHHGEVGWTTDGQGNPLLRFIPDADYNGPAQFGYTVSDGTGGEAPATMHLTIRPVNDAPRLVDDAANTLEDQVVHIDPAALLANDTDVDDAHDTLAITAVSDAQHGQVALVRDAQGAPLIVFTPEANYHGAASFQYTVSDPHGAASTATATLNIAAVNDAPVATGEQAMTNEDHGLRFTSAQLLANDTDPDLATDGDVLHIARVDGPQHGTVSLDGQGDVRFLPDADYHGPASFRYWVADAAGAESAATMDITVAPVNDSPVAHGERLASHEDTELFIQPADLLAHDSDVDTSSDPTIGQGQSLGISAVSNAQHGHVELVTSGPNSGLVHFVPDANFHGTASFDDQVSDGAGGFATATTVIDLAPVNDAPVTRGEAASGDEDHAFVFHSADLLANDSDVDTATDGDVLRLSRVGHAQHGTVSLDAQGDVHFVPDADYNGPAQFTYWVADRDAATLATGIGVEVPATVQLTVNPVNDAPVVVGETVSGTEDTGLTISPVLLLANDQDVDNTHGDLRITDVGNARHGSVALDGHGHIVFTPDADYNSTIAGPASFDYTVTDGSGGFTTGTARVELAAVNDAPVATGESIQADEDQVLTLQAADLLANDTDVDTPHAALTITAVGDAQHGSVALDASGHILFTPDADYNDTQGTASFHYTVSDGAGGTASATAVVHLTPVNDAPTVTGETATLAEDTVARLTTAALLANDSDVDTPHADLTVASVGNAHGGAVALVNGEAVFTPTPDYNGAASFDYVVSDGAGGASTATVNLTYTAVNDAPVATGEIVQGRENQPLVFTPADLLANDTDVDTPHGALTITGVAGAQHGTVGLAADGHIVFTPEINYNDSLGGPASFTYTVSDGAGGTATTTALVDLAPVNQAPTVTGETVTLAEDTVARFTTAALLANDTDVDNPHTALTVASVGNAQGGTVAVVDGEVVFTPMADFNGAASFDYVVTDGAGGASTATVSLAYTPVNDAPVAVGEVFQGQEDQTVTFSQAALLANDSDVDTPHAALTITRVSNARHGAVAFDGAGNVVFTPDADDNDTLGTTAQFDYTVSDGAGGTATATTVVHLAAVNDAPAAQGETVTGALQDAAFHVPAATLLANDSDVDDAPGTLRLGWVGNAAHGAVALDANGDVVFTPAAGFTGDASFDYRVADPAGALSPLVTASIPVGAVNHNPVAVDDRFSTYSGSQMLIQASQLLGNDSDADGDALTLGDVANAQHGTVSYSNGVVQFTPEAGYMGPASFQYEARDGQGGSAWGTAYVDVLQANVVPVLQQAWISNVVVYPLSAGQNRYICIVELDMASSTGTELAYQLLNADGSLGQVQSSNKFYFRFIDDEATTAERPAIPSFAVRVSDPLGNWTDVAIAGEADASMGDVLTTSVLSTHVAPIVLDLDGDGVQFDPIAQSAAHFDLDGDGKPEHLAWAARGDGTLVFDANGDHIVNGPEEFAFTRYLAGARTDLEGLRAFDTNHDGRLDAGDKPWALFGVWQDANGDGKSTADEFKTLDQLGIASVDLHANGQYRRVGSDVTVMGETVVTHTDGRTSTAADASFMARSPASAAPTLAAAPADTTGAPPAVPHPAVDELHRLTWPEPGDAAAAQAWEAEIARRAHRFIELANWCPPSDEPALTFVPSSGFGFAHHGLSPLDAHHAHDGQTDAAQAWAASQHAPPHASPHAAHEARMHAHAV